MNPFIDSPAFLTAKLVARRDYYELKANDTDRDARLDTMYGPRDGKGHRHGRIEVLA